MYFLGYDIGTSSVKASIIEADTGKLEASAYFPKEEQPITSHQTAWAEQDPEMWWNSLKEATKELRAKGIDTKKVIGVGISYQMHGLVVVDGELQPLRPSIIWCDSRAVTLGDKAFRSLGEELCLEHLLNSPGNFTASKLKWVKENEPSVYEQIYKIMLPGDFIAMRMTGEVNTTISGLSEGILWDFKGEQPAQILLEEYGIDKELLPELCPTFGEQGKITATIAEELGLAEGTKITYRAGDQPNNALSLNVMNPGEIAATAGTSGVIYGVSDELKYDPASRVNTFAHVNHTEEERRLGILLCINGTGIQNSWLKNAMSNQLGYEAMNTAAASVNIGSEGLLAYPFGNGAERVLGNQLVGGSFQNIDFNKHTQAHLCRAVQEGIVFAFRYGISIMQEMGMNPTVIRAGKANMFQSPVFTATLAGVTGAPIELYETDGSRGAAMGAAYGFGYFDSFDEAFKSTDKLGVIEPETNKLEEYENAYQQWKIKFDELVK
ncbi:xylulokinase [Sediminitomix flava]|uniref:Xylulokinase n=1 Tax=Sediminitomix flava TaxID=379075 RepID=A0A315ZX43_SEDFL|nr:FGGY family carbohydrate kinase [Sediminitomix flava]PWJ41897.1 xylulokinase [Sediminitomix flava]